MMAKALRRPLSTRLTAVVALVVLPLAAILQSACAQPPSPPSSPYYPNSPYWGQPSSPPPDSFTPSPATGSWSPSPPTPAGEPYPSPPPSSQAGAWPSSPLPLSPWPDSPLPSPPSPADSSYPSPSPPADPLATITSPGLASPSPPASPWDYSPSPSPWAPSPPADSSPASPPADSTSPPADTTSSPPSPPDATPSPSDTTPSPADSPSPAASPDSDISRRQQPASDPTIAPPSDGAANPASPPDTSTTTVAPTAPDTSISTIAGGTPAAAAGTQQAAAGAGSQGGGHHGGQKKGPVLAGALVGVLGGLALIGALLYFLVFRDSSKTQLSTSHLGSVKVVPTHSHLPPPTATAAVATGGFRKVHSASSIHSLPEASPTRSPPRPLWKKVGFGSAGAPAGLPSSSVEASAALMQLRGAATLFMSALERSCSAEHLQTVAGHCRAIGEEASTSRMFVRQAVLHRIWSWLNKQLWSPQGPCWQEPLLPENVSNLQNTRAVAEAQQRFRDRHRALTSTTVDASIEPTIEEVARWMAADLGLQAQGAPWLREATGLVHQAVASRLIVGTLHPCLSMRVTNASPPVAGFGEPLDAAMPRLVPSLHSVGRELPAAVPLSMDSGEAGVLVCMLPGVGFEAEVATLRKQGVTVEAIRMMEMREEVAVVVPSAHA